MRTLRVVNKVDLSRKRSDMAKQKMAAISKEISSKDDLFTYTVRFKNGEAMYATKQRFFIHKQADPTEYQNWELHTGENETKVAFIANSMDAKQAKDYAANLLNILAK